MENTTPTFESFGLHQDILKAVVEAGFTEPSPVQVEAIPLVLAGNDIVAQAQTGTGKTAAFGLPTLSMIDAHQNKVQLLVITPTRELATQVSDELYSLGRFCGIKTVTIYGGSSYSRQIGLIEKGASVIVATPGRMLDLLKNGRLPGFSPKMVVLDEADEMLNMGFIDQVEDVINYLPKERQTMLFSATMSPQVNHLTSFYMKADREMVKIAQTEENIPNILHSFVRVDEKYKTKELLSLLIVENPDACIIFCNTQDEVDSVVNSLYKENLPVDKIHGGMEQKDRLAVMDDFRTGRLRYLVATDVAARGIDIDNITHVINYDVPFEKESYTHRTGRTARAGKTGLALTMVTEKDQRRWAEISEYAFNDRLQVSEVIVPNKRAVDRAKDEFEKKIATKAKPKVARNKELNKDITKIYFNGGKKKKLRAGDFVGTITSIRDVEADDIGIITIQENVSYVEILNGKGPYVIAEMQNRTVKNKKLKVRKAHNRK